MDASSYHNEFRDEALTKINVPQQIGRESKGEGQDSRDGDHISPNRDGGERQSVPIDNHQ